MIETSKCDLTKLDREKRKIDRDEQTEVERCWTGMDKKTKVVLDGGQAGMERKRQKIGWGDTQYTAKYTSYRLEERKLYDKSDQSGL